MEPTAIIRELGGGLAAVVIVTEALVALMLWRRVTALQDRLFEVQQQSNKELREMQSASHSALSANSTALAALAANLRGRAAP